VNRRRARVALGVAAAAGVVASLLAACFPDYAVGTGDGGADGSTTGDGAGGDSSTGGDSTTASDGAKPGDGGADGAMPGDGASGDTSTFADTGLPVLDGSIYDGAMPTGMTLFQPGTFHFKVYTADDVGNWDAAVNATATLDYAFAIDDTEVTTGAFQDWLDAGLPTPGDNASLDPGGPYASVMVWKGSWTSTYVQGASNAVYEGYDAGSGCGFTGGVAATLPRGVPGYPVSCVNWFQAQAYCAWKGKRLPTDTEWRVAATNRGENPQYPWGTTDPTSCTVATGDFTSPTFCNFPVAAGSATGGGTPTSPPVYDLQGSLEEWAWDPIYPSGYSFPAQATNFYGPAVTTQTEVQRQWLGASYESTDPPAFSNWQPGAVQSGGDQGYDATGFRCARTL
jgi:formylglycine-generating enzyme required for sulfatase activity